jgi:hypothetical protein
VDLVAVAKQLAWRFPVETIFLAVLLCFVVNMVAGFRANARIVKEFAHTFLEGEGSLWGRNFARHGTVGSDPSFAWREARNQFVFYATGRRYVGGMLTTLDLVSRQDLFMGAVRLVYSTGGDVLRLEVRRWACRPQDAPAPAQGGRCSTPPPRGGRAGRLPAPPGRQVPGCQAQRSMRTRSRAPMHSRFPPGLVLSAAHTPPQPAGRPQRVPQPPALQSWW